MTPYYGVKLPENVPNHTHFKKTKTLDKWLG
nr:MAG TPA: hypothetical protein [Caudoviricetes sp.]DAX83299.1 MAG TPA: hypothetical protein [Caudoviricetes sp.]